MSSDRAEAIFDRLGRVVALAQKLVVDRERLLEGKGRPVLARVPTEVRVVVVVVVVVEEAAQEEVRAVRGRERSIVVMKVEDEVDEEMVETVEVGVAVRTCRSCRRPSGRSPRYTPSSCAPPPRW